MKLENYPLHSRLYEYLLANPTADADDIARDVWEVDPRQVSRQLRHYVRCRVTKAVSRLRRMLPAGAAIIARTETIARHKRRVFFSLVTIESRGRSA